MAAAKKKRITVKGITVYADPDAFDDIDVLELMAQMQDGDIFAFPRLCRAIFGEEGFRKIKVGLAGDDGRTRLSDMSDFFGEAIAKIGGEEAKN